VFSSNRSGASNIWVCEEDGRARQLTQFLEAYTDSPRWSPSGDKILLTTRLGESREVLELDLKTNRIRQITDHPADDGRATYSRDGTTIFFRSDRSGRNEIWRVPASGGEARQLTKNGAMEGFGSPDGKLLYYTKDRPQLGVWSIPIAGGPETKVTGEVRDTRWAVADDGIYYLTTVAPLRIMRYAFATRQTTEVAQLPGSAQVWAGFSASPDGKVFVWPQTALDSSDIAILDFQP
jgi:Tol biopolymer transport system component